MKLKYKIVTYSPEGLDEELLDKEKDGVKYLSKKAFDKAAEDGLEYRIVGKTRLKEAGEDDEKVLTVGEKRYLLEDGRLTRLVGYIPVGDGGFVEYRKTLLPFLLIIFALLGVLICGIVLAMQPKRSPVVQPDYELVEQDESQIPIEVVRNIHMMVITLPQGDITFDGAFFDFANEAARAESAQFSEAPYSGTLHMKAWRNAGSDTLIFDDTLQVNNGEVAKTQIDFTIQKAELIPGVYDGTVELTYADGSVLTEALTVVIRSRSSGSMGIGFAPEVSVNRTTGTVSCYYEVDYTGTHDTIVQLILDKNDEEFLLAESGIVTPGHSVTHMSLKDGVVDRVVRGEYSGRLRLNFYSPDGKTPETNLNTDIEVKIHIQ